MGVDGIDSITAISTTMKYTEENDILSKGSTKRHLFKEDESKKIIHWKHLQSSYR